MAPLMSIDRDPTLTGERYCPTCERTFSADRCPDDGTQLVSLETPQDPLIGREVDGRFTIQDRLGAGGMGTVYRAVQHSVGRPVAVKIVNPTLVSDPQVIKRFLREAKLTSRLSHPNAVAVLDFGQTRDGLFYLVMELLAGRTLRELFEREGRFDVARLARVGGQICDALDGAHRLEIVHRDLKPSNIMVLDGAPGRDLVKVLDFGLAKSLSVDTTSLSTVTSSGALLGTPAYMPPEAALGREVDARADLYSLGVILYQLASGRLPFVADTIHELIAKQAFEAAPPLQGLPPALEALIQQLLAKEPDQRPASAAAVHAALDEASRGGSPSGIRTALAAGPAAPSSPALDETLSATTGRPTAAAPPSPTAAAPSVATAAAPSIPPAAAPSVATAAAPPSPTAAAPSVATAAALPSPPPTARRRRLVAAALGALAAIAVLAAVGWTVSTRRASPAALAGAPDAASAIPDAAAAEAAPSPAVAPAPPASLDDRPPGSIPADASPPPAASPAPATTPAPAAPPRKQRRRDGDRRAPDAGAYPW
jgi:eukaryotic-like serine/threonine-protein kinase